VLIRCNDRHDIDEQALAAFAGEAASPAEAAGDGMKPSRARAASPSRARDRGETRPQ